MAQIHIQSDTEIDYTVLYNHIKKSESTTPKIIGKQGQAEFLKADYLTAEQKEWMTRLSGREKLNNSFKYPYTRTKTNALTHPHEYLYRHGIAYQSTYTLVKIDLIPCIMQLIQVISGMKDFPIHYSNELFEFHSDEIAELIAGTIETDEGAQEVLKRLLSFDNDYLNMYIQKALTVSEKKQVTVIDAFNVERLYNKLHPIEAILSPITYSLYNLQYILAEKLRDFFKRGEKRFACIDKFRMYYFVRSGGALQRFIDTDIYLEGVQLNITFEEIKPHYLIPKTEEIV